MYVCTYFNNESLWILNRWVLKTVYFSFLSHLMAILLNISKVSYIFWRNWKCYSTVELRYMNITAVEICYSREKHNIWSDLSGSSRFKSSLCHFTQSHDIFKIFYIYSSEPRQGQQIVQRNRNNICLSCYKLFVRQAANNFWTFKNTWLELFGQQPLQKFS